MFKLDKNVNDVQFVRRFDLTKMIGRKQRRTNRIRDSRQARRVLALLRRDYEFVVLNDSYNI